MPDFSSHERTLACWPYLLYNESYWRDAGVVELACLENKCASNGTQGSNPCLSATRKVIRFFDIFDPTPFLQPE